jgi:hypothetical protein
MAGTKDSKVNLLDAVAMIHKHLTAALCRDVFQKERGAEREREWTLFYLVKFWTAVIIRAPRSLTQALMESSRGSDRMWPAVQATPEAFFQKCRDFKWTFFFKLYTAFLARILPQAPKTYAADLGSIWIRFPEIWLLDGSKLDAIRHRLKILWEEKGVFLPGCLSAVYDLGRGITRALIFSPDAAEHELERTEEALAGLPKGALMMGDRAYALPAFVRQLNDRGAFGLFRRNKRVKLKKVKGLSRRQGSRTFLEDVLVQAGSGQTGPKVMLRLIRFRFKGFRRDLVTSVLDPRKLSAKEALQLYPFRWRIERMFFDLKEVLNLHRFYAANSNAVAMQVYAAAIVHTAFRVAQAKIAQKQGLPPETLSTAKLFPKLATVSSDLTMIECYRTELAYLNPGRRWREPNLSRMSFASTTLQAILLVPREGERRKRTFHPLKAKWKSLAHIRN